MTVLKRNFFRAIATKKVPSAVSKGAKKISQFARAQLRHPAVANFVRDTAGIAAASGFNPEVAMPAIAARTALEGIYIAFRTARHFVQ